MARGRKMPASGLIVEALSVCSGVKPLITGKPNPITIDMICEDHNLEKKNCLIIGDSLRSDIALGINSNISSLLVLTGNTKEDDLTKGHNKSSQLPTYYSDSLA
jgi:4-nitrophenyl phosphatase